LHNRRKALSRLNCKLAVQKWGLTRRHPLLDSLRKFSEEFELSVLTGDLMLLQTNWYVTHTGLLRLARRNRCSGMRVQFIRELSDPSACRFAFEATVFTTKTCTGFTGYGDANPSNVSPLVHGAEMRVAETRAVNRALRKAYGIGICSVEEIGSFAEPVPSPRESKKIPPQPVNGNNGNYGGPKVRDRLCQLIRQHQLDANLVKSYAVEFCGTKTLREATRSRMQLGGVRCTGQSKIPNVMAALRQQPHSSRFADQPGTSPFVDRSRFSGPTRGISSGLPVIQTQLPKRQECL
jgi:hypothetical protein